MSEFLDCLQRIYNSIGPRISDSTAIEDIDAILWTITDVGFCIYNENAELIYTSRLAQQDEVFLRAADSEAMKQRLCRCPGLQLDLPLELYVPQENGDRQETRYCSQFPIYCRADRVYHLVATKREGYPLETDALLCSAAAMSIGSLLSRAHYHQTMRDQSLRISARTATNVLSYSEAEAIRALLCQMEGMECTIVISDFANRIYVTRSVISSALRKMESSDVFLVQSLGMRGTYIRVNNPFIFECFGCPEKNLPDGCANPVSQD